ncbi:hypothetical protein Ndes2526B_g09165 [Nannochloris sp. 'desiccata']
MPKNTGIQESKPVEGPFSGMYIHQIKSQSLVLFGFKTGRDPLWSYCRDMWDFIPVDAPFSGMYIYQIKSQSLIASFFIPGRDPH